jgi:hypothetical protein
MVVISAPVWGAMGEQIQNHKEVPRRKNRSWIPGVSPDGSRQTSLSKTTLILERSCKNEKVHVIRCVGSGRYSGFFLDAGSGSGPDEAEDLLDAGI